MTPPGSTAEIAPSYAPEVYEWFADVRFALRFSQTCSEAVTRQGSEEPCEKLAVALRVDPQEEKPYAVCAHHARGDMVSLAVILAAVADGGPA